MDGGSSISGAVALAYIDKLTGASSESVQPAGLTIGEMIRASSIPAVLLADAEVWIEDPTTKQAAIIYRQHWETCRPRAGLRLVLRAYGGKGGGGAKSILGIVLSIAVLAASAFLGPVLIGPTLLGSAALASAAGGLLSGAIGIVGKLLISALIPPPRPPKLSGQVGGTSRADSPTYSISGAQNSLDPFGVVPRLYGRFRYTPKYAAKPYTEIVGSDQFLRLLFDFGYGPLQLEDHKIGETPLDQYQGVETDIHSNWDPNDPDDALTLYTDDVDEDQLSIEVKNDGVRDAAVPAEALLVFSGNVANNDTVTVGSKTYTFKTSIGTTANNVLVGINRAASIDNLAAAINRSGGAGTLYTPATVANANVTASAASASSLRVVAVVTGTGGNTGAVAETSANAVFENRILTVSGGNAGNGETVTVDGKAYSFQTSLTDVDGNVLIGASASASLDNLVAAINLDDNSAHLYAPSTTAHPTARAVKASASTLGIAPLVSTASLTTAETMTHGSWGNATLAGGAAAVQANPWLEDENWVAHSTQGEGDEFSFDITFLRGLVQFTGSGAKNPQTARFDARYRVQDSGDAWTYVGTQSSGTLTFGANPGDTKTVTIGAKVYTFQTTLTNVDGHVKIGANAAASLANLAAAINLGAGAGSVYAAAMTRSRVNAGTPSATQLTVTARSIGDSTGIDGDAIATTTNVTSASWAFPKLSGGVDAVTVTAKDSNPVRVGKRVVPAARAQWEVNLRRITKNSTDTAIQDEAAWTALRTITLSAPVAVKGRCLVEMRIKATDQLNGVISSYNAIATSMLRHWNGATWDAPAPTRNPADIYLDALQGAANGKPLADARIDLAAFLDWWEACAATDADGDPVYCCDGVFDFRTTVYQALADIASTGRATPDVKDGLFSIVRDIPQTVPVQHFTDRNSWGFKGTIVFPDTPDGLRVQFKNEAIGWQADERTVYADGFDATNAAEFEVLPMPMVTRPKQVWRDARYLQAVAKLRPATYQINVDPEWMQCRRGDLVMLAHDAMRVGIARARIKSLVLDGDGNCTALNLDEELTIEPGKTYAVMVRRAADNATLSIPVLTLPGISNQVELAAPLVSAAQPDEGDLLSFGESALVMIEALVKGIDPGADQNALLTLVDAAPAVHTADQGAIPAYQPATTALVPIQHRKPPVPVVTDIRSDETVLNVNPDGSYTAAIAITFGGLSGGDAPAYQVESWYRRNGSDQAWSRGAVVPAALGSLTILGVDTGETYDLRFRSLTSAGVSSDYSTPITHTVVGDTSLPDAPLNPRLSGDTLLWDYPTPPRDFAGFRVKAISGGAPNWMSGFALTDGLISRSSISIASLTGGTFTVMVKAVDRAGNESAEAPFVVTERGDPEILNAVASIDIAAAGFLSFTDGTGAVVNGSVVSGPALEADTDASAMYPSDPAAPMYPSDPAAGMWSAVALAMTYNATFTPDAGLVGVPLKILVSGSGAPYTTSYSSDGGANFVTWPGEITTEAITYQLRIVTQGGGDVGLITGLTLIYDVPDQGEVLVDIAISSAGTRLPITKAYRSIDHVGPQLVFHSGETGLNFDAEDNGTVTDNLVTAGPLIKAYDKDMNPVDSHGTFRIHGAKAA